MRSKKIVVEDYSWINDDPLEEEIDYNDDGSEFMPIYFVERKLTRLDSHWGTENFKFQLLRGVSGLMFVDASGELVVTYGGRTRKLVGAATWLIPPDINFLLPETNTNLSATALAEATKNAAKKIGAAFGQKLNDRDKLYQSAPPAKKNGRQKKDAVKLKADPGIRKAYAIAVAKKDQNIVETLEAAYDFN